MNFEQFAQAAASGNTLANAVIIEQTEKKTRRIEWLNQRRGLFTASEFHKLMTVISKPDELPKGAISYVRQKVAESLTNPVEEDSGLKTPAMQWGNDYEHAAIDEFVKVTGLDVKDCKDEQVFLQVGEYGGTPDGVIITPNFEITGIEVKCQNSETHVFNMENISCAEDLKKHYPEYYWQVQGLMLITGADYWYWVSFDPRFVKKRLQLHIVKVDRVDDDIVMLSKRLVIAIDIKKSMLKQLDY